jgi:hypothetical protein
MVETTTMKRDLGGRPSGDCQIQSEVGIRKEDTVGAGWEHRKQAIQGPLMLISSLAGMNGVCDVSRREELVDDNEDVQGKTVLVTSHGDIIDDDVTVMQADLSHLGRHEEHVFELACILVDFDEEYPAGITVLEFSEFLDNGKEVSS